MDNLNNSTHCLDFVPAYAFVLLFLSCLSSIIGSGAIFWTYIKLPEIRNFSRRLLLFLSAADLLNAAGNLIGGVRYMVLKRTESPCYNLNQSDVVCIAQSYVTTCSSLASFLWTSAIVVYILAHQLRVNTGISSSKGLVLYNLVCTGVPVIITSAALGSGALGANNSAGTGGWCWINSSLSNDSQTVWMLMAGKFWEIVCYILTTFLYMYSKLKMKLKKQDDAMRSFRAMSVYEFRLEENNFVYFCFSLYLLRCWGTSRFFIAVASGNVQSVGITLTQNVLLILQSIGDSWQGFWNFVVFCLLDRTVRAYICACCQRFRRGSVDSNLQSDETTPILPVV